MMSLYLEIRRPPAAESTDTTISVDTTLPSLFDEEKKEQPSSTIQQTNSTIPLGSNTDKNSSSSRRRAFSYDIGESGSNNAPSSNIMSQPQYSQRQGSCKNYSDTCCGLQTIPSYSEMGNNNDSSNSCDDDLGETDRLEEVRRHDSLSSTHTRRAAASNRNRSISSDIILNISSDNLPRYDDELACQIKNISSDIDEYDDNDVDVRGSSFSTPERRIINRPSVVNRDRANTCPHRPQRHSMMLQHHYGEVEEGEGDEESGHHYHLEGRPSPDQRHSSERNSLDNSTPISSRATPRGGDASTTTERLSHSARSWSSHDDDNNYVVPLLRTPRGRNNPRRTSSSSQSQRGESILPIPPITIPSSPASINRLSMNRGGVTPSSLSSTTPHNATTATSTPLTTVQRVQNFLLYRINHVVMKSIMVISLYMLLAYSWNTDLQFRYKSIDINYGLSEYWNGGISSNSLSSSSSMGEGKLSINGLNDDENGIANLLANGVDSSGSEDIPAEEEDGLSSSLSIMDIDKRKHLSHPRRPSLSYARSILSADSSHPAYEMNSRHRAIMSNGGAKNKWTVSRLAWVLVWMGFMIPIVEAAVREVRRQINVRFWNVRRLGRMPFRRGVVPSGSRAPNVHNL